MSFMSFYISLLGLGRVPGDFSFVMVAGSCNHENVHGKHGVKKSKDNAKEFQGFARNMRT